MTACHQGTASRLDHRHARPIVEQWRTTTRGRLRPLLRGQDHARRLLPHPTPKGEEIVALDRVVSDGPWPGSRTRLIDTSNLGKYFFEVIDRETNQVIYSRGFASVYGEWETTGEAKERTATFHESLRFPWPKRPVQVVLKKRDAQNAFQQIWSTRRRSRRRAS